MRQQPAALLLLLYLLLPVGVGYVTVLVAQTLLHQIKAINLTRQLEKRLASSVTLDEGLTLLVFWLKWHRIIQNSLSINAVTLNLWSISLIYHLKYGIYGRVEAFKEFLLARWFDPDNAIAHAYLGLFTPCPVFLSHLDGDRITGNGFTLIGQADPNVTILCEVSTSLSLLGGLVSVAQEDLLETEVQTDENGRFEVYIPVALAKPSGTRYIVSVIVSGVLEMTTGTQMTLIQA